MDEHMIQNTTYWLMGAALSTVRGRVAQVANSYDMTDKQAEVLCVLLPGRPQSIRILRDQVACDASSATGILDRLEKRGLVERLRDPEDRRIRTVGITPAGLTVRSALMHEVVQAQSDQLQKLSVREVENLKKLLRKIGS